MGGIFSGPFLGGVGGVGGPLGGESHLSETCQKLLRAVLDLFPPSRRMPRKTLKRNLDFCSLQPDLFLAVPPSCLPMPLPIANLSSALASLTCSLSHAGLLVEGTGSPSRSSARLASSSCRTSIPLFLNILGSSLSAWPKNKVIMTLTFSSLTLSLARFGLSVYRCYQSRSCFALHSVVGRSLKQMPFSHTSHASHIAP